MNISKKQKLVLDAINEFPEAANNDALLLSLVWEREKFESYYNIGGLGYALMNVTRPETITRRRRELFNMGLIKYSDKALEDRTDAFKSEVEEHHKAISWLND